MGSLLSIWPLLELSKAFLEKRIDLLHRALAAWTLLVAIGLILEYSPDILELCWKAKIKKRGLLWVSVYAFAGPILVTVGVGGELVVEARFGEAEGRLREIEGVISGQLRLTAARANERASANERAAESERLERRRLEARVSPRGLTLNQQRKIAEVCKKFSGHRALVSSYGLDGEGAMLAGQILEILRLGLRRNNVRNAISSRLVTGRFESGIHLRGQPPLVTGRFPESEREFASALQHALSTVGKLDAYAYDSPPRRAHGAVDNNTGGESFPSGTVFLSVFVGLKPTPVLTIK